jgi:hypothetical protein
LTAPAACSVCILFPLTFSIVGKVLPDSFAGLHRLKLFLLFLFLFRQIYLNQLLHLVHPHFKHSCFARESSEIIISFHWDSKLWRKQWGNSIDCYLGPFGKFLFKALSLWNQKDLLICIQLLCFPSNEYVLFRNILILVLTFWLSISFLEFIYSLDS